MNGSDYHASSRKQLMPRAPVVKVRNEDLKYDSALKNTRSSRMLDEIHDQRRGSQYRSIDIDESI